MFCETEGNMTLVSLSVCVCVFVCACEGLTFN